MGFSLISQNNRDLWKEWELRLLVLLSLFLQLTLATQGSRRKSIYRNWIQVVVWSTYLLAESIATLTLGIMSNRLANIKEMKGMIDQKSQIIAFWAPFLLLHLGGPDTVTAYALEDNELWLRQLARLCVQVGIAGHIYFMALAGSTLSILAAGIFLVGFIKYAERILCLYLASEGRLRDSMLPLRNFGPIYPRKMGQYTVRKEEGYRVTVNEVTETPAPKDLSVNSGQAYELLKAYELFKIFKLLFVGLIVNIVNLDACRRMVMAEMDSEKAFRIVEIELGFMYDLLYTKAQLLNRAWGFVRWVISLSVPCAVLVFFSLQDKKDKTKVDICITFLLISVAILVEIYSLLLAISSDWVVHWWIQRPRSTFSSALAFLQFRPSQKWSNRVAQLNLLRLSIRKRSRIFCYPRLAELDEKVGKNFYIDYKELSSKVKESIFHRMKRVPLTKGLASPKLRLTDELKRLNCHDLTWSVEEMEFDQIILVWHIATELCHYEERRRMQGEFSEDVSDIIMSMLVSQYMLYLLVFHPSMLPTSIGAHGYKDTSVEAQKFFEDELAMLSKNEGSISLVVSKLAQKLLKKEAHGHTRFPSCEAVHESRESRDLCEVYWLLLQVRDHLPASSMRGGESASVLFDGCQLASQLEAFGWYKWDVISMVWVSMLVNAACQCKGSEHCKSLSRGGELLSHVWLLMAHLGIPQPVQTSGAPRVTQLSMK